jgi:hypothetical protein
MSLVSEPDIDVHSILHGLGLGNLLKEEDQRTVRESIATIGSVSGVSPRAASRATSTPRGPTPG